ncbi:MAG: DUF1501 domain-containing protein [Pirellulales bacterium]
MLKIRGSARRLCDGVSRRQFIQVGGLGVFGLTLADLLRTDQARAAAGKPSTGKSVILVWQHGGPSQLDTFDPKPAAVSEVRGPYGTIATKLPGIRFGELMTHHAKVSDKISIIRSFTHDNADHFAAAHWMLTAYMGANGASQMPRYPSMGSIVAKKLGARAAGVPPYVNINDGGFGYHGASYLGVSYNPFRTGTFSYGNEGMQLPSANEANFQLTEGLTHDRLVNRVELLDQLDSLRRQSDGDGTFENLDRINQQALEMVLSGKAREAFDLQREDPKTRERYGDGWGEQALLARRLIESGVRFVTLNTGYWDDHGNIKGALDDKMPRHDRAVGVLIEDLAERGLLEDTLVVTAGEFGRTPRINKDAGRDHWPQAQSIVVAGGGYRAGQVIGETNAQAEHPISRPVGPLDLCAIVYRALGLTHEDTVQNLAGRPMYILPGGEVPPELV